MYGCGDGTYFTACKANESSVLFHTLMLNFYAKIIKKSNIQ
jgi:hypothetical protein